MRLPLSVAMIVLRSLIPFVRRRLDFERLNLRDPASKSFKRHQVKADLCFEISSEGELEQSSALISKALSQSKKIEIIYSSPSVEEKCQKLYFAHVDNVRLLRLPLLSNSPFAFLYFQSLWQWVSSEVIVFCRYDFYPELLLLKFFNKKLVLLSATTKKLSWYKKESFKFFSYVVAATAIDQKQLVQLNFLKIDFIKNCDLRVPRIIERKKNSHQVLNDFSKVTSFKEYLEFLDNKSPSEKIIFGSVWPSDIEILNDKILINDLISNKIHLCLVPHQLKNEFIEKLVEKINLVTGALVPIEVLDGQSSFKPAPIIILKKSGVLCELYTLFRFSYIGGGYERSIHSVLEPFFMNNIIIVGPKTHRSTELEIVQSLLPDEIHVLKLPNSFYNLFMSIHLKNPDLKAREKLSNEIIHQSDELFKELLP